MKSTDVAMNMTDVAIVGGGPVGLIPWNAGFTLLADRFSQGRAFIGHFPLAHCSLMRYALQIK